MSKTPYYIPPVTHLHRAVNNIPAVFDLRLTSMPLPFPIISPYSLSPLPFQNIIFYRLPPGPSPHGGGPVLRGVFGAHPGEERRPERSGSDLAQQVFPMRRMQGAFLQ